MKQNLLVGLLSCLLFFLVIPQASSQERYCKVRLSISSKEDLIRLARLGFDLEGVRPGGKRNIDLFITDRQRTLLQKNGYVFSTLIEDWYQYYDEREKEESLKQQQLGKTSVAGLPAVRNFHLGSMGGFLSMNELSAELDSMRSRYPELISAKDSIGASYEKRPMWAVKMTRAATSESTPQALYLGVHHAREPIGMMVLVYYMWYMLENYGTDPLVTKLLDTRELYFIPLVNPDGYYYNQQIRPSGGGQWRTNRHINPGGTYGVDLNRNYDYKWGYDDIGSSPKDSDMTYRGTAPFSEPETQTVRDFVKAHHFRYRFSYHAYWDLYAGPWAYDCTESADSMFFRRLAKEFTQANRYEYARFLSYSCNGEWGDWMYGDTLGKVKTMSYTSEVGSDVDGFWPSSARIVPLAIENLQPNIILAQAAGNYLSLDKTQTSFTFQNDTVLFSLSLQDAGTLHTASTVDITLSSTDLVFDTTTYVGIRWQTNPPLSFRARSLQSMGTNISVAVKLQYDGGLTYDTLRFRMGPAQVLYADDAEQTRVRWKAATDRTINWDTTSVKSHSGRYSFSESPTTNYENGVTSTFTLDSSFVLNGKAAELKFWFTGESEVDFDCMRVEVSAGESPWVPMAGNYSTQASGSYTEMPFGSPVYDGDNYEWVEETVDLTRFCGQSIKLRFRFTADAGFNMDGFYVDDIKLVLYPGTPTFPPQMFDKGILLVNGVDLAPTTYTTEMTSALTDSAFWGKAKITFWDCLLSPPSAGYPSTLPAPIGSGPIPLDTLMRYSTIICLGNPNTETTTVAGDLSSWQLTPLLSYLQNGGNVIILTKGGYSLIDAELYYYLGMTWIATNRTITSYASSYTGLSNLRTLGTQSASDVFSTTLTNNESTLLFTGTVSGLGTRGVGVWRKPVNGGVYKKTGGQCVYIAGRPYRWNHAQLRANMVYMLSNFMGESTTGILNESAGLPTTYRLNQNYPNPFNPTTVIRYHLPAPKESLWDRQAGVSVVSRADLRIYDLLGREVAMLVNEEMMPGTYSVTWNAEGMASGIYFYTLRAGGNVFTKKMVLLR